MTNTHTPDLPGCPFCGGPAKVPFMYNGIPQTHCAGGFECPGTECVAPVAGWNRRAPADLGLLEALKEARSILKDAGFPPRDLAMIAAAPTVQVEG